MYLLFCGIILSQMLSAQINAVTETGDAVLLYDDGSWQYLNAEEVEVTEIPLNPQKFKKPKDSDFLLKSKKADTGLWLNPKKWSFTKAGANTEAEYEFQLKDEDLFGMMIVEKIEIPLINLKDIALMNARAVAPDIKVVKEEYRDVNGMKVLFMQLNGTLQGIKFSYFGYYYSTENLTVQLVTYTSQNLLEEYRETCEKFVNGLVEF